MHDSGAGNFYIIIIIIIIISGVGLSPLGTAATSGLLYKSQMIDKGDCVATGGMKIGRGNLSTRRKPAPAPLCPPQIPHDQTEARTRAAAVGSQRLTAWAMARPGAGNTSPSGERLQLYLVTSVLLFCNSSTGWDKTRGILNSWLVY
jgi:hypothetical protein